MQNKHWILRNNESFALNPFGVMGIVNVSTDSFYDKGRYSEPELGLAHARTLWREGAHILDIGAESTRPGALPISANEEINRLMPVLNPLMDEVKKAKENTATHVPYISVDTYHADTAKAALHAGVHIINDISACLFDPELLDVVVEYKPGYVLMHSTGRPEVMQENLIYDNIVDNLRLFFEFHLHRLTSAGLPESNIVLDVGIGFGKTYEQNMELLHNLHRFQQLGLPILIALSMKSFLHTLLDFDKNDFEQRAKATQSLTNVLATQGFCLHRVHHVADTINTLRVVQNF